MPNHIPLTKAEIEKLPEAEQQSALQDIGRFLGQLLNTETDKAKKLIAKLANEFDFDPNALMDMAQPQSMSDVAGMALPGAGLAMGAIKGVSGAMKGKAAAGGMGKTEPILQSRMGEVISAAEKGSEEIPKALESILSRVKYEKGRFLTESAGGLSKADKDAIDAWLVKTNHPLASQAGTQEHRIEEIAKEIVAKREIPPVGETAQVVKPGVGPSGLQPPGAGTTSMEAVARTKRMKESEEVLYRVDQRSKKSTPIITGVDAPDIRPGAYDVIMRKNKKTGVTEIVDMGSQAKKFLGN